MLTNWQAYNKMAKKSKGLTLIDFPQKNSGGDR